MWERKIKSISRKCLENFGKVIYIERCIIKKERNNVSFMNRLERLSFRSNNSIQIFYSVISLNNLRAVFLELCSICGSKVCSFCVPEKIPQIGDLRIWRSFVVTKVNIMEKS